MPFQIKYVDLFLTSYKPYQIKGQLKLLAIKLVLYNPISRNLSTVIANCDHRDIKMKFRVHINCDNAIKNHYIQYESQSQLIHAEKITLAFAHTILY